jgi:Permuted papain-like amidase enzyme, YaeF/YiiX, C92 family
MKRTLQFTFLFCISLILFTAFRIKLHTKEPLYKTGDLIFQNSHSSQSEAIKLATHSKFSHVGVIVLKNNTPFVLEAVEPVSLTPLKVWIARGDQHYFEVKRPKQNLPVNGLTQKKIDSLQTAYINKHYDVPFQWTDDKLYCSELVWKFYQHVYGIELCATRAIKEFDLSSPLVKMALKQRYGEAIPMNEQVVSPEDLYQSSLLQSVK